MLYASLPLTIACVQLDYPTTADGYILLTEIGRGAFATVYRAKVKERNEDVAIKVLDLEELNTNWDEIRVSVAKAIVSVRSSDCVCVCVVA